MCVCVSVCVSVWTLCLCVRLRMLTCVCLHVCVCMRQMLHWRLGSLSELVKFHELRLHFIAVNDLEDDFAFAYVRLRS